jgi:hypothetical protein
VHQRDVNMLTATGMPVGLVKLRVPRACASRLSRSSLFTSNSKECLVSHLQHLSRSWAGLKSRTSERAAVCLPGAAGLQAFRRPGPYRLRLFPAGVTIVQLHMQRPSRRQTATEQNCDLCQAT